MTEQHLKRVLGRGFSIAACVGLIVGLGILQMPGQIASAISDPWVYMGLWIAAGAFTLLAVAVAGELMAETPRSGGYYVLVAHAYGPYPGFVIGWVDFLSGVVSMALKTLGLMTYLALLVPVISDHVLLGSLLTTTFFAAIQFGGVRLGGSIHQIAVMVIGLSMVALVVALFLGTPRPDVSSPEAISTVAAPDFTALGLVVAAVIFTYDGWYAPSAFGGEIKGGGREVALGALRGTVIVTALYLLINLALVQSVPLASLAGSDLALAEALEILYGTATPIIVLAVFILLTHQNLNYMGTPRTLYALSVDGLGSSRATTVGERGTPRGAVMITWCITVVLLITGSFESLLSMAAMMFMLEYLLVIYGVFRLRKREPRAHRPYRAWGFPYSGYICVIGYAMLSIVVGITQPQSALYTAGLVLVSAPIYMWLKTRRQLVPAAGAD